MDNPVSTFILKSLLKSAVHFEESSVHFYNEAISRVSSPGGKDILRKLASEEDHHKEILEKLSSDDHFEEIIMKESIANLHEISGVAAGESTIENNADFGEIVRVAELKEKAAYDFYKELALKSTIPTAQKVFVFLAEEEEKHLNYIKELKTHL